MSHFFSPPVIWVGQNYYLTMNATSSEKLSRDGAIFWTIYQLAGTFGNLFVYLRFSGESHISNSMRMVVYGTLTTAQLVGVAVLTLLPPISGKPIGSDDVDGQPTTVTKTFEQQSAWQSFCECLSISPSCTTCPNMVTEFRSLFPIVPTWPGTRIMRHFCVHWPGSLFFNEHLRNGVGFDTVVWRRFCQTCRPSWSTRLIG